MVATYRSLGLRPICFFNLQNYIFYTIQLPIKPEIICSHQMQPSKVPMSRLCKTIDFDAHLKIAAI